MLPRLNPDQLVFVDVQQTAFSHDVLGRWVCSTWDEVSKNGGDPFDVVVIGAGMFGGYIADKLYRRGENIGMRVLVIDAGDFLLPTHVQNLPRLGLNPPKELLVVNNSQDPARKIWFGATPGTAISLSRDWRTVSGGDLCFGVDGRRVYSQLTWGRDLRTRPPGLPTR